jgi:general secretion pathway protein G
MGFAFGCFVLFVVALGFCVPATGDFSSDHVTEVFVNESLETPLYRYKIDNGAFPSTEQGLAALLKPPPETQDTWRGPYIDDEPIDPWGNPYQYRQPGLHHPERYDIWSLGPDGVASDDDIGNW